MVSQFLIMSRLPEARRIQYLRRGKRQDLPPNLLSYRKSQTEEHDNPKEDLADHKEGELPFLPRNVKAREEERMLAPAED
jgi:hypothetical protein